jgi:hypothetical protein
MGSGYHIDAGERIRPNKYRELEVFRVTNTDGEENMIAASCWGDAVGIATDNWDVSYIAMAGYSITVEVR